MEIAFGLKAHSGWAALLAIGKRNDDFVVVDRRRIELVSHEWEKQPYHAAEHLKREAARALVKRGIAAAQQGAVRELRAALKREHENEVTACAVLVTDPMPPWSIEEILAVHFRMHKAEGVLFRDSLVRAAKECQLRVVTIPEKQLAEYAERALSVSAGSISKMITMLGKSVGPPWGRDQKDAALAALTALRGLRRKKALN